MKKLIIDTVSDLVKDFLYYGRKEDELGVGDIQKAVEEGIITKEEIIEAFRKQIEKEW